MTKSDFLWQFPCYVLATAQNTSPLTGEVLFDDKLRFVAPSVVPGEKQGIAIFTDSAMADEFRELSRSPDSLKLAAIPNQDALRSFLQIAERQFQHVAIDLNRKTRLARLFLIQEILDQLNTSPT